MLKHRYTFLMLGLLITAIPLSYAEESPLVNVSAITWKNTTVIKVENNNDNVYNIKLVWFKLENGIISSYKSGVEGWNAELNSDGKTIQFRSDTNMIKPGQSTSFGIKSDQEKPIFKWLVVDEDGDELGSGLLDVSKTRLIDIPDTNSNVVDGSDTKIDTQNVSSDSTSNGESNIESNLLKTPPSIAIRPDTAEPGSVVKIIGEGFTPKSVITVLFDGTPIARINTDNDGAIKGRFNVPDNAVNGRHQISVSDKEGRAAIKNIEVKFDEIIHLTTKLDKTEYNQGELVTITGTGKPNTAAKLSITNPNGQEIFSVAVQIREDGKYTAVFALKADAIPGAYTVSVTDNEKTTATFMVLAPTIPMTIITDKFEYMHGEQIKISGVATPNKDINIRILKPDNSEIVNKSLRTDSNGVYEIFVPVLDEYTIGKYSAIIKVDNDELKITFNIIHGSVTLTVNTEKPEYRVGELVKITGNGRPDLPVLISIHMPDEKKVSLSVVTESDGSYVALWLVSENAKKGRYDVTAEQGDDKTNTVFAVM